MPAAVFMLASFALWTAAVRLFDVQPIGPQASTVGFAALNQAFHRLTGVHMSLYTLTDWLGLIPIATAAGFAFLGLMQWIKRRSLFRVDPSLFILGGFYIAVIILFIFFEICIVNYRPVLIHDILEASYPSSTTMLALCIMPTAMMQLHARIKSSSLRRHILGSVSVFTAFMVIGRLISGVHWLTDIIGGILLSTGLVMLYRAVIQKFL